MPTSTPPGMTPGDTSEEAHSGLEKNRILITTVPPEAMGGIAALHKVLFGPRLEQDYAFTLFPVGSPAPHGQFLPGRLFRILARGIRLSILLMKDRSIRIVHVNTSDDPRATLRDSLLIFISRIWGRKVLLQIHSAVNPNESKSPILRIRNYAYSLCDRILVFSRSDSQTVRRLAPLGNTGILPNAINTEDFRNRDASFRKTLSIPETGRVVLFISRIVKDKGVWDLIESIPEVVRTVDNAYFVFAGDGPERESLEAACRRKDLGKAVRFTGNLPYDDVRRVFACADVFVLPSYNEGMPMSILQALAAGLPIVVTPVGAIPDFLADGVNGFFVPPRSPRQLAERIVSLLRDDTMRKNMGEENVRLAEREFDAGSVSSKLKQVYETI